MLTIWGRANSGNTQKVLWCAAELNLPFERIDRAGAFGGTDTPDYLGMNPNGRVPTIRDGDFVLWESNAIVRYLAATYGAGTLWPNDPARRALADRWMDWQQTSANHVMRDLYVGLARTRPERRDLAAIQRSRRDTAEVLARLDRSLAACAYVGGDGFTMGDIPIGMIVHRWFAMPIERPSMPNLEAWYARLTKRPGFVRHVMPPEPDPA